MSEVHRDDLGAQSAPSSEGEVSFSRGLLIGGILALGAFLVIGDLVRRRSVVITDTGRGEIRISRDALEGLIRIRCEALPGVLAVQSRARRRGDRTALRMAVTLAPGVDVAPTVGRVSATVCGELQRILDLRPEQMSVTVETIRVPSESEAAESSCPDDERE